MPKKVKPNVALSKVCIMMKLSPLEIWLMILFLPIHANSNFINSVVPIKLCLQIVLTRKCKPLRKLILFISVCRKFLKTVFGKIF